MKNVKFHPKIERYPEASLGREYDFQIACAKLGPHAVIGGMSALFYYNLVEQVPKQTWVLVPPHKITSNRSYRLIRTQTPLDKGIVAGNGYQVASIERAIMEGFKLASKIGERTAIHACRTAIQQKQTTLKKIGMTAKELGLGLLEGNKSSFEMVRSCFLSRGLSPRYGVM